MTTSILDGIAPSATGKRPRGRLFRKYAVLFAGLVGGALVAESGVETWFSYQENKAALIAIQHEKATAAAGAIEGFVREIERQIGWTTQAAYLSGAASAEQRRIDFLRLLRQAPAITDLAFLDAGGRRLLLVSRLAMDEVGSGPDLSATPEFRKARAEGMYVSPVRFRNGSEPYITLALAGRGTNRGVTVADVNLKLMWDVISRLHVGKAGHAYVVDSRGLLIAHPDIGLVLRKTDLSRLPQVAAVLHPPADPDDVPAAAPGPGGGQVLTAHAAIAPLGWTVFVEQPLSEAFEPLYAALTRDGILLAIGLALATLAGLVLARRMVGPIHALADGAARIGDGAFDRRIDIRTGDELESLAGAFNRMGAHLSESYATLERRVEDRTRDLVEALEHQTATSDILRAIASTPSDANGVLDTIAETARRMFGASSVLIRRIEGDVVHLVSAAGVGYAEIEQAHRDRPLDRRGYTGLCAMQNRQIHIPDLQHPPEGLLDGAAMTDVTGTSLLLGNRTVCFTPLAREGEVIGVMVVNRTEMRPFAEKELVLMSGFADQAVIAIENARLLAELRAARDAAERNLVELRAAQANLIQAEKMASLGQLTAGIAHEIKNPLNFVNNFAGLSVELLDELKDAQVAAMAVLDSDRRAEVEEILATLTGNLVKIAEHGRRADGIVKSMLAHSRGSSGDRQKVHLNALIEESLNLAYHGARAQDQTFNITLERDLDPSLDPVEVVPQDLTRVFLNLFANGFYATAKRQRDREDRTFVPTLRVSTRDAGEAIKIRICDNGVGIGPEVRDKLFQPFFTTKPTGEGTGLGLSISYEIVTREHGGQITVESTPGEFTEFTVTIPKRFGAASTALNTHGGTRA